MLRKVLVTAPEMTLCPSFEDDFLFISGFIPEM